MPARTQKCRKMHLMKESGEAEQQDVLEQHDDREDSVLNSSLDGQEEGSKRQVEPGCFALKNVAHLVAMVNEYKRSERERFGAAGSGLEVSVMQVAQRPKGKGRRPASASASTHRTLRYASPDEVQPTALLEAMDISHRLTRRAQPAPPLRSGQQIQHLHDFGKAPQRESHLAAVRAAAGRSPGAACRARRRFDELSPAPF